MAYVPNEILGEISTYLTFYNKLEASLTCHRWYQAIAGSGKLYEALCFFDAESLKGAIKFFKKHPQWRDRVLDLDLSFNYDAAKVAQTFPNIKRLRWGIENDMATGYADPDDAPDQDPSYCRAIQGFKQLEAVVEQNGEFYPIVVPLLKCPRTANNLTSITFHFFNDSPTSQQTQMVYALTYKEKVKRILPLLRFAPRLKYLELSKLYLTLHDMEDLHNCYAPRLEELVLKNMLYLFTDMTLIELMRQTFKLEHSGQPIVVKEPARKIKNLYIDFSHNIDRYDVSKGDDKPLLWLDYVAKKYTYAQSIAFGVAAIDEGLIQQNIFQGPLISPPFPWQALTALDLAICDLTKEVLTAMDAAQIHLRTVTVYFRKQTAQSQTASLLASRQRESIRELFIKARGHIEPDTEEGKAMYALAEGLLKLTYFDVTQEFTFSGLQIEHAMIPELLERAPQLEGMFIEKISVVIPNHHHHHPSPEGQREYKLKEIGFGNVYCRTKGQGELFSKTWNERILPACPKLEKLDIYVGRIGGPFDQMQTEMVLDFKLKTNHRIREIEMNFYDETYFCIQLHGETQWWLQDCPGAPFERVKQRPAGKRYISLDLNHSFFLNDRLFS
ncbi:uncharacterized protein BX663DRAFT_522674 [Cokeromyces recurvatus]|uniref:uncharacterized protein n=1 Tax=Cokeromyces recurvatus TaxID=90255 RepID=UPI00221F720F|nr:uncharacterized protein BX663DRAFT_522674 [Cokeromyces recurvatus]KAI7898964.1 hypothetical protein BX663DRAFT_522674 [Cokeromyces recurvatus]